MRSVLPDTRIFPHDSEVRRVDEALGDAARFDPGGASAMQVVVKTHGSPLEPANLRRCAPTPRGSPRWTGVRGVRSPPFDELDPDALTPDELARKAAVDPVATQLAHMVHEDVVAAGRDGRAPLALGAARRTCSRRCATSRTRAST